jgi:hypothetical protein
MTISQVTAEPRNTGNSKLKFMIFLLSDRHVDHEEMMKKQLLTSLSVWWAIAYHTCFSVYF